MSEYDKQLTDPAAVYDAPEDVLNDDKISKAVKLAVLKKWEYDVLGMMVAEEENMSPDNENGSGAMLDRILAAIHKLDPNYDARGTTYTKHGGK